MSESFVDLTYRGLSLARRVRLSQVRPTSGFLELAAPMPVGAQISITSEDGAAFDAVVTSVSEQIAGADRAAGMIVAPALDPSPGAEAAAAWWAARVTLAESDEAAPRSRTVTAGGRSRPLTVRPRAHSESMAAVVNEPRARITGRSEAVAPPDEPEAGATLITAAMDAAAIAAAAEAPDASETDDGPRGDIVDDGKRTVLMNSVDPALLGGDDPAEATATYEAVAAAEQRAPDAAPAAVPGGDGDGDGDGDDSGGAAQGGTPGEPTASARRRQRKSRR